MILFADDTTIFFSFDSIDYILSTLHSDMKLICEWLRYNRLVINWTKTHAILFDIKKNNPTDYLNLELLVDGEKVPFVSSTKILGVTVDHKLRFDLHIASICKKVNSKLFVLNKKAFLFTHKFKETLFKLFIQSRFDYCSSLFFHCSNKSDYNLLVSTYNKSINKLFKLKINHLTLQNQYTLLTSKLKNILPLQLRLLYKFSLFIFSLFNSNKSYELTSNISKHKTDLRTLYSIPYFKTDHYKYSFSVITCKLLRSYILPHLQTSMYTYKKFLINNINNLYIKYVQFWT